jgi:hypothetical protein
MWSLVSVAAEMELARAEIQSNHIAPGLRPGTQSFAPCDIPIAASMRAGFEARGLIFGAPLALALKCAFVPLRKPGKLPGAWTTVLSWHTRVHGRWHADPMRTATSEPK